MNLVDAYKIIKSKGILWVIFRSKYEISRKTGLLKRKFPTKHMRDQELFDILKNKKIRTAKDFGNILKEHRNRFFLGTKELDAYREFLMKCLNEKEKTKVINIADNAIDGKILCFSKWEGNFGNPINWHLNPIAKYSWPKNIHWIDLEELSKETGDVKYVWEASRFPHFYYFVRAYTLTKDEKYAKAYWDHVESWIKENPNNYGINWKCGQEIAFRMFAWLFGLYVFLDSSYTTDERIVTLYKNLYQSIIRIENNIDFAVKSVQNNHSISEAAGLFTFAILFPFFEDSERLLEKGKKHLEQEGLKQIYDDGTYIQNSMNYHRLMLQDYTWCYRLAEINGYSFTKELTERINKSIYFIYQMQDEVSGMVPNYGANDGTLLFPLSVCDYLDYRPQINTINFLINKKRLYKPGLYDEDLLWFCGIDAVNDDSFNHMKRVPDKFAIGGYYTFRNGNYSGMVKCCDGKNRPNSADMLHFDLWYKGINLLCDIGSYSYNPEEKFRGYFGATKNHNTITINGRNQIKKGPRFLTIEWANGFVDEYLAKKKEIYFKGHYDTYKNTHKREIIFGKDNITIVDYIKNPSKGKMKVRLTWNIGTHVEKIDANAFKLITKDETFILGLDSKTKGKAGLYYGNNEQPIGWRSLYYGEMIPMNQLDFEVESCIDKEAIVTKIYMK